MSLELVAEVLLDQPLPWLTPSEDYVLLNALGDEGGCRLSWPRNRHRTGFWRSDSRPFGWFSDHHVPDLALCVFRPSFRLNGKFDFYIVNNIEYGYHPKKCGIAKQDPPDTACGHRSGKGEEMA